jgi:hydrogenase maturation protease
MTGVRARIVGIGQEAAGDDAIGIAVARKLNQMDLPDDVEVIERAEPFTLIAQLTDGAERVILIDAIVDVGSAGRVIEIDPLQSGVVDGKPLSTHGIGLLDAIELARILNQATMPPRIVIVGITIKPPASYEVKLSDSVAAAILPAAELALRLAAG